LAARNSDYQGLVAQGVPNSADVHLMRAVGAKTESML